MLCQCTVYPCIPSLSPVLGCRLRRVQQQFSGSPAYRANPVAHGNVTDMHLHTRNGGCVGTSYTLAMVDVLALHSSACSISLVRCASGLTHAAQTHSLRKSPSQALHIRA